MFLCSCKLHEKKLLIHLRLLQNHLSVSLLSALNMDKISRDCIQTLCTFKDMYRVFSTKRTHCPDKKRAIYSDSHDESFEASVAKRPALLTSLDTQPSLKELYPVVVVNISAPHVCKKHELCYKNIVRSFQYLPRDFANVTE